uniref:Uncharacterized protein n=1 Tax=Solanum lycopersicum TaxID=4081 RepID=A0A3Q7FMM2_SOLLC
MAVCKEDNPFAQKENKLACELKFLKKLASLAFITLFPIVNFKDKDILSNWIESEIASFLAPQRIYHNHRVNINSVLPQAIVFQIARHIWLLWLRPHDDCCTEFEILHSSSLLIITFQQHGLMIRASPGQVPHSLEVQLQNCGICGER